MRDTFTVFDGWNFGQWDKENAPTGRCLDNKPQASKRPINSENTHLLTFLASNMGFEGQSKQEKADSCNVQLKKPPLSFNF